MFSMTTGWRGTTTTSNSDDRAAAAAAAVARARLVSALPRNLMIYDGQCVVCDTSAIIVHRMNRSADGPEQEDRRIYVATRQSDVGQALLAAAPQLVGVDSVFLVECRPAGNERPWRAAVWSRTSLVLRGIHGAGSDSHRRFDVVVHSKTDAAAAIADLCDSRLMRLGGALVRWCVPRRVGDWLYDVLGRHRYRILGQRPKESCTRPSKGLRDREWNMQRRRLDERPSTG
jgi:predicted DCC family thiol-disulfide oxidoreductase YuxK